MTRQANTQMKVLFINGAILVGKKRDLLKWVFDPANLVFIGGSLAIFLIYYGYLAQQDFLPDEVWQMGLTVVLFVILFFACVLCFVFLAFEIAKYVPGFVLPLTLVIVVTHVLVQILGVRFVAVWGIDFPDSALLYQRIIAVYFLVVTLEIIYSVYVLPKTQFWSERSHLGLTSPPNPRQIADFVPSSAPKPEPDETKGEQSEDTPAVLLAMEPDNPRDTDKDTLWLNGSRFDAKDILMIRAEQNYVNVETSVENVLIRAKIKEAVEQLDCSLGIQAHRSYWVSFGFVARTRTLVDGKLSLELDNGEIVSVPRARQKQVKQALEAYAGRSNGSK